MVTTKARERIMVQAFAKADVAVLCFLGMAFSVFHLMRDPVHSLPVHSLPVHSLKLENGKQQSCQVRQLPEW